MKRLISEAQQEYFYEYCKQYIDNHCIWRSENGERIPGKIPGTFYTWQFYMRRGLFNPVFATAMSLLYLQKIQDEIGHFDFQIAGLETASTPVIVSLCLTAYDQGINLNAFSVRKERKEYGLRNWFEGIPNNLPVMLCDDLCNSQNSMAKAKHIVESNGLKVMDTAFAVVNKRNSPTGKDFNLPQHMNVISLFNLDDFNLVYHDH